MVINGNRAYVVNRGNFESRGGPSIGSVSVVNIRTAHVMTPNPIEVGLGPEDLAISGTKVYVANSAEDTISVIDTETNAADEDTPTIAVAHAPLRILVVPWGGSQTPSPGNAPPCPP
jgi:YVTN family beta-propeller protein